MILNSSVYYWFVTTSYKMLHKLEFQMVDEVCLAENKAFNKY